MGCGGSVTKKEVIHTEELKQKLGGVEISGRFHTERELKDDYTLQDTTLGEGYNGQVFLATDSKGNRCAVKPFNLVHLSSEERTELRNETELFLSMDHPHIARLRDVYQTDKKLFLVMECMEGGELFERIKAQQRFSEENAAKASKQMLLAVNYIHSKNIVHRDIKLENFLYDAKKSDHLKLIDFGFSRIYKADKNEVMEGTCGTLAYMAPEVLDRTHKGYNEKCDVWSVGCVVFILLLGYMPFQSTQTEENFNKIKNGEYPRKQKYWNKLSPDAVQFIEALLTVDSEKRPSAAQALELPFIKNRDEANKRPLDESIVESLREYAKTSPFRRACMSMMAWSLTNDDRASVRNHFIDMDTDKKGVLTFDNLKTALAKYSLSDTELRTMFEHLDSNSNQEVNYTDFLAAMMTYRIVPDDTLIEEAYTRFDIDKTGFITAENLKSLLSVRLKSISAEDMIAEADDDKDKMVSRNEFFSFIKKGIRKEKLEEQAEIEKQGLNPKRASVVHHREKKKQ